jgi:hypothetical protein
MPRFQNIGPGSVVSLNDSLQLAFSGNQKVIVIQHGDRSFPLQIVLAGGDVYGVRANRLVSIK